jgi:antibiotic biosynthesis monooxygenase (ABM) superfamily enzyme
VSDEFKDPSANTQAFQAWVDNGSAPSQEAARSKTPIIVAVVVVAVIVLAGLLFLAFG